MNLPLAGFEDREHHRILLASNDDSLQNQEFHSTPALAEIVIHPLLADGIPEEQRIIAVLLVILGHRCGFQ